MSQSNFQFPDTYSNFSHTELVEIYAAGPERLRAVVKDLTLADLTARPIAGKWSIKEIVLHLADAEIMGAARIRQTFAEPGSTFAFYDQDVWTREFDYQNYETKSYYSYLIMFDALRLATTKIFQRAVDEDWKKSAQHPELGELTLRQLLEIYADHSERHIGQILERRNLLNKPLDFALLLKERLY